MAYQQTQFVISTGPRRFRDHTPSGTRTSSLLKGYLMVDRKCSAWSLTLDSVGDKRV